MVDICRAEAEVHELSVLFSRPLKGTYQRRACRSQLPIEDPNCEDLARGSLFEDSGGYGGPMAESIDEISVAPTEFVDANTAVNVLNMGIGDMNATVHHHHARPRP